MEPLESSYMKEFKITFTFETKQPTNQAWPKWKKKKNRRLNFCLIFLMLTLIHRLYFVPASYSVKICSVHSQQS